MPRRGFLLTPTECWSRKLGDLSFLVFFFLRGGMPLACGRSWTRDQTHTTAATQAPAMKKPDTEPAGPQGNASFFLIPVPSHLEGVTMDWPDSSIKHLDLGFPICSMGTRMVTALEGRCED